MSKVVADAPITTRNARAKLAPGLHWRVLDSDVHLGYRKGARGGRWVVRWRVEAGGYSQETIGAADDLLDADGEASLSFHQACARGRGLVQQRRANAKAEKDGPAPTVRTVIEAYIGAFDVRLREARETGIGRRSAGGQLKRHVLLDEFAEVKLHELTRDKLQGWRTRLAEKRLAAATVRRICNDLRAALNAGIGAHHSRLPAALPLEVKAGLAVADAAESPIAREAQILPDADIRRIISATWEVDAERSYDGDLGRLVLILAATGARFSQVARMLVSDVQLSTGRLMIPVSRKGKGKAALRIAVPVGEDVLAALRPAIAGRIGTAPLLEHWRHKQLTPTVWSRIGRGPWGTASELTRPWSEITKRAGLPSGIVPYALRHSSIVRGLRQMLPVRLVAALHDTSSAMIELHYSAYIVSALDELAARAVVPLHDVGVVHHLQAVSARDGVSRAS